MLANLKPPVNSRQRYRFPRPRRVRHRLKGHGTLRESSDQRQSRCAPWSLLIIGLFGWVLAESPIRGELSFNELAAPHHLV